MQTETAQDEVLEKDNAPDEPKNTDSNTLSDKPPMEEDNEAQTLFECNICLDTASQPVITLCGHLFCWPCIYQWMISNTPLCHTCPVCKSAIEKEKLIPIYTRGKNVDPRTTIPERPQGQRTEASGRNNGFNDMFQGFQFTTGTTVFHFGAFGIVPLFLQLAMNSRNLNSQNNISQGNSIASTRGFLSRASLMIGILFLFVVILY